MVPVVLVFLYAVANIFAKYSPIKEYISSFLQWLLNRNIDRDLAKAKKELVKTQQELKATSAQVITVKCSYT